MFIREVRTVHHFLCRIYPLGAIFAFIGIHHLTPYPTMRKFIVLFGLLTLLTTLVSAQKKDFCSLQGAVYIEKVAAFADYRVFVDDNESFADLVVYKEDSEVYADAPGHWFITDNKAFADFTIYIEEVKNFADFSIAYTTFRTAVGCR